MDRTFRDELVRVRRGREIKRRFVRRLRGREAGVFMNMDWGPGLMKDWRLYYSGYDYSNYIARLVPTCTG